MLCSYHDVRVHGEHGTSTHAVAGMLLCMSWYGFKFMSRKMILLPANWVRLPSSQLYDPFISTSSGRIPLL